MRYGQKSPKANNPGSKNDASDNEKRGTKSKPGTKRKRKSEGTDRNNKGRKSNERSDSSHMVDSAPRRDSIKTRGNNKNNNKKKSLLEMDYISNQKMANKLWFKTAEASVPAAGTKEKKGPKGKPPKMLKKSLDILKERAKQALQAAVDR